MAPGRATSSQVRWSLAARAELTRYSNPLCAERYIRPLESRGKTAITSCMPRSELVRRHLLCRKVQALQL